MDSDSAVVLMEFVFVGMSLNRNCGHRRHIDTTTNWHDHASNHI